MSDEHTLTLRDMLDSGLWQEIHRVFLHPLGLSLRLGGPPDASLFEIVGVPLDPTYGWFETAEPNLALMANLNRLVAQRAQQRKAVRGSVVQMLASPTVTPPTT